MAPLSQGSQSPADTLPHSLLGMGLARGASSPTEPIPFPSQPTLEQEVLALEPKLRLWILREHPSLKPELDDIIQEAFLRALRAAEKTPIRCLRTYLFGIARHVALTTHRRHKKNSSVPISELPEESTIFLGEDDMVQAINHQQQLAMTFEAIQALPDRCREIVVLHTVRVRLNATTAGRIKSDHLS